MNKEIFFKNYKDSGKVYYVPGYLSGEDNQEEAVQRLEEFFECDKHPWQDPGIDVFKWDSFTSYAKALHNSYEAGNELIRWLLEEVTDPITIVGHSLGALVISNAMKKLPRRAVKPIQIILLGAAMDSRADLSYMCSVTEYPVVNVVNPNDVVLSTVYRTCTDSYALGQVGSKRRNRNYIELELLPKYPKGVAGSLLGEVANQLLDLTGHSASRVYLDSLIKGKYKIRG